HAAEVVQRDLKPHNVMLSPVGPKVIDFGIAVPAGRPAATGRELRFGTPGWLAPEQLGGQPGGPPSDVFTWGLLVMWAATGRHPFGPTAVDGTAPAPTASPDLTGLPPNLVP